MKASDGSAAARLHPCLVMNGWSDLPQHELECVGCYVGWPGPGQRMRCASTGWSSSRPGHCRKVETGDRFWGGGSAVVSWWGGGRRQDIILIFIRHVQTPLNNKTKGGSDSPLIHVLSNSQQQAGLIIISCLAALIKSDKFSDMLIQNVISNYKLNGCCDSRCHPQYQSHSLQLLLVVILQSFSSCFVS